MYIKANPNNNLLNEVNNIIIKFKEFIGDTFIEQLDERAGLGCHPYHITLIGNINKEFKDPNIINRFLSKWNHDIDVVEININNCIKITNHGTVLLLIESPYLIQIGNEMLEELSNNVSSYLSNLHITLGKVFDKNLFNKTLFMNDDLYSQLTHDKPLNYSIISFGWDY
jgi:hypothetical protein